MCVISIPVEKSASQSTPRSEANSDALYELYHSEPIGNWGDEEWSPEGHEIGDADADTDGSVGEGSTSSSQRGGRSPKDHSMKASQQERNNKKVLGSRGGKTSTEAAGGPMYRPSPIPEFDPASPSYHQYPPQSDFYPESMMMYTPYPPPYPPHPLTHQHMNYPYMAHPLSAIACAAAEYRRVQDALQQQQERQQQPQHSHPAERSPKRTSPGAKRPSSQPGPAPTNPKPLSTQLATALRDAERIHCWIVMPRLLEAIREAAQ